MWRNGGFGDDFFDSPSENGSTTDERFRRMRERFDDRSRTFREQAQMDSWDRDGANSSFARRSFKTAEDDERGSYVRNIPIVQQDEDGRENLMNHRDGKSSIPRPVPPQQNRTSSLINAGKQQSRSSTPDDPTIKLGRPSSESSGADVRQSPESSRQSKIDSQRQDSKPQSQAPPPAPPKSERGSSPLPGKEDPSGRSSPQTRKDEPAHTARFREIPVKILRQQKDTTNDRNDKTIGAIPMGFVLKERDTSIPIPMGFDRPASAPGERTSTTAAQNATSSPKAQPKGDASKERKVPIVVRNDDQRASSAPPPRKQEPSKMDKINDIINHTDTLQQRIDKFKGSKKDHEYKLLDELLTQSLIKLDSVEPAGDEQVRKARKDAIKKVEDMTQHLERKGNFVEPENLAATTTRIVIPMGPAEKDS